MIYLCIYTNLGFADDDVAEYRNDDQDASWNLSQHFRNIESYWLNSLLTEYMYTYYHRECEARECVHLTKQIPKNPSSSKTWHEKKPGCISDGKEWCNYSFQYQITDLRCKLLICMETILGHTFELLIYYYWTYG